MVDACEVFAFDEEKVNRLRGSVGRTEGMAPIFKALADETRLKIIDALCQEDELCVCDVAMVIGCSVPVASHHLRLLKSMRLAKSRKSGRMVYYSLHDDHVRKLLEVALEHFLEQS